MQTLHFYIILTAFVSGLKRKKLKKKKIFIQNIGKSYEDNNDLILLDSFIN